MRKSFLFLVLALLGFCLSPCALRAQTSQTAPKKSHHLSHAKRSKSKKKSRLKKKVKKKRNLQEIFIPKNSIHWKPVQVFKEKKRKFKSALFVRQIHQTVEKIKNKKTKKIKIKKVLKGDNSTAKAFAAFYGDKAKGELIVSVFPKSLEVLRKHLELRFSIFQGRLTKVSPVIVSILDEGQKEKFLNYHQLEKHKIAFSEDFANSGKLWVSHLSVQNGKKTLNSARLEMATFGENAILGVVSAEFSIRGLIHPT